MIRFSGFSYRYPRAKAQLFRNLELEIPAGRFVWIAGPSASGKSTFLRTINGLVPRFHGGTVGGDLEVFGRSPIVEGPAGMAPIVAFVFQDPERQFVTETVEDEIVFSMEQLGYPHSEMEARVREITVLFGLVSLLQRPLEVLSSGERQKVALASALVLRPRVLLLDEPASQLDLPTARGLYGQLRHLVDREGLTVLCVEHQAASIASLADDSVWFEAPGEAPVVERPVRTSSRLSFAPPSIAEGACASDLGDPILLAEDLTFAYGNSLPLLQSVTFDLRPGECVAVVGPNGSGKTTLLRILSGFLKATSGRVTIAGLEVGKAPLEEVLRTVGCVPQDPSSLFFHETLREEVLATRRNRRLGVETPELLELLREFHLEHAAEAFPRDLSAGEQQRAAIATILAGEPRILFLDEPTRGMDVRSRNALVETIRSEQTRGTAVLLVSHDEPLVRAAAARVFEIYGGRLNERRPPVANAEVA